MKHRVRTGHILLDGAVEDIIPLFTPLGETRWVPDWQPVFIDPVDGATTHGMVFRTSHDNEETIWACCDWRPEDGYVRYARVTPSSRFVFVEVHCRQRNAVQTEVEITYHLTALTPEGERYVEGLSEAKYASMLEEWHRLISEMRSREELAQ